jgi:hypothetical protein
VAPRNRLRLAGRGRRVGSVRSGGVRWRIRLHRRHAQAVRLPACEPQAAYNTHLQRAPARAARVHCHGAQAAAARSLRRAATRAAGGAAGARLLRLLHARGRRGGGAAQAAPGFLARRRSARPRAQQRLHGAAALRNAPAPTQQGALLVERGTACEGGLQSAIHFLPNFVCAFGARALAQAASAAATSS